MKEIDFALVEEKRPPIYTCMKYWGKKPHNIWHSYIELYTPKNGVFLDPFFGSGMSLLEAFRANRKAIGFDINPLSSFLIEALTSDFDVKTFDLAVKKIIDVVSKDKNYIDFYCYKSEKYILHNVKYCSGTMYECCFLDNFGKKIVSIPNIDDKKACLKSNDFKIPTNLKFPNNEFRDCISFSKSFKQGIGCTIDCLYTKRNLYVLALIFNEILKIDNSDLKTQLLFGFIQSVHLCSKMCIPRGKNANRDFSTSWGRSAYIYSKKQMEMNPLLVFKNTCCGRQSVEKALLFAKSYFPRKPKIQFITDENKIDLTSDVDIWYGIVDSKKAFKFLKEKTVDFVLTDPPYGGVVQYLDLSNVWLSWLSIFDKRFVPNYNEEITINQTKTIDDFCDDISDVFFNINQLLKENGKMVLTFNNNDLHVWSSLLRAIRNSEFDIQKIVLQRNRRTGESNVANPYGTSANDFYIRCLKKTNATNNMIVESFESSDKLDEFMLNKVKYIISQRAEPTPFQILFNAFLTEFSNFEVRFEDCDQTFQTFIKRHIGKELISIENNINDAGDFIWINNLKFDEKNCNTLTNKIKEKNALLFKENKIQNEQILLQSIFKAFPNSLMPDPDLVFRILNDIATKKGDMWVLNEN